MFPMDLQEADALARTAARWLDRIRALLREAVEPRVPPEHRLPLALL
ncbi:MAG: hypothetical protein MK142_10965 [Pseudomonadales bacterium]|nr:hypothetical protein [Pseudomonadales bacterium]